jgi:hypothetical protein
MVDGRWSMVDGRWSMVDGRWSMVDGRWSMVDGRRGSTESREHWCIDISLICWYSSCLAGSTSSTTPLAGSSTLAG